MCPLDLSLDLLGHQGVDPGLWDLELKQFGDSQHKDIDSLEFSTSLGSSPGR